MSRGSGSIPQVEKSINVTITTNQEITEEVFRTTVKNEYMEVVYMTKKQNINWIVNFTSRINIKAYLNKVCIFTLIFLAFRYGDGLSSSAKNNYSINDDCV